MKISLVTVLVASWFLAMAVMGCATPKYLIDGDTVVPERVF